LYPRRDRARPCTFFNAKITLEAAWFEEKKRFTARSKKSKREEKKWKKVSNSHFSRGPAVRAPEGAKCAAF
jgi:hypothetical protein